MLRKWEAVENSQRERGCARTTCRTCVLRRCSTTGGVWRECLHRVGRATGWWVERKEWSVKGASMKSSESSDGEDEGRITDHERHN